MDTMNGYKWTVCYDDGIKVVLIDMVSTTVDLYYLSS